MPWALSYQPILASGLCVAVVSAATPVIPGLTATVSTVSSNSAGIALRWITWILLFAVLAASVPVVVCMPLTSDTVLFDLQARIAIDGGVLYRDAVEPNFPGIVWIHAIVRSVIGWSSESLRMFDLGVVGLACILLTFTARDVSRLQQGTIALPLLFMALFYLSRNEWCHCQRDSWMLLPVSVAIRLRTQRLTSSPAGASDLSSERLTAFLEGIAWGIAAWIKPHVAVSLVAIITHCLIMTDRPRRSLVTQVIVAMGLTTSVVPGIAWLWRTGALSWFLEMQLEWNPEYLEAGADRRSAERIFRMLIRFHPWWILHIVAVPIACFDLAQQFRDRRPSASGVLAVLYLSWLLQASIIQHAMDYIQVPPMILGIAFLASRNWSMAIEVRRLAVALAFILAILNSKQLESSRLSLWWTSLCKGSSPHIQEELAHGNLPRWNDIEQVTRFLRSQNVRQGDVTSWNVHTIHIYRSLELMPSTRYPCVSILKELFPSRSDEIQQAVSDCGHRYVVTNRAESRVTTDEFPWNLPVVFQSGQIEVRATSVNGSLRHSD